MNIKFKILTYFIIISQLILAREVRFDYITVNEGLGDNFVRRLYEDKYGFIWIGTKDGISRYDGYSVKTYSSNVNDSLSLPSGYIGAICEDNNENLWIGTGNGLALYDREYDVFRAIFFDSAPRNSIYSIVADSIYLWLATSDGLCKFDINTYEEEWFFSSSSQNQVLQNNNMRISRLAIDNNCIWIGFADENGLIRFNTRTYKYEQYYQNSTSKHIPGNRVSALSVINDSIVMVGYRDLGVYTFNKASKTFSKIQTDKAKTFSGMSMPWSFLKDRNDNIWIGTINGGLFCCSTDFSKIENYIFEEADLNNLNSMSVSEILEDKYGNLWFGTHGGGLNVIFKRKSIFSHYYKKTKNNSISYNYVSSFFESKDGQVWIGTDGGGLNLFEKETGKFNIFTTDNGLSSNSILSINEYSKDTLLLSSWDGGVIFFNIKDYSSKNIGYDISNPNSLSFKNIKDAVFKKDSIFIATHGNGLNIYDSRNKKMYHAQTDSNFYHLNIPENGNKILFDSLGNMWIATNLGLYKMYNNKIQSYLPNNKTNSIVGFYVTDIFIDSKNNLWAATLNGLNKYDYSIDGFHFSNSIPELSRAIMSIAEDNLGNLWLGSNNGLIKYNPSNNDFFIFDKTDGLQGNQFFERAAFKDSEGNMYFGGSNGFNIFNPKQIKPDSTKTEITFTDFKIFNISQQPNIDGSVLKKHINYTSEIELNYSQKMISIDFVAINMLNSSKNEYAYMLEGFDNKWYYIKHLRSATFTNLKPGKYTFKVKACNTDKVWTETSKDIIINILPPFWMTLWFKLLSVISILGIILFYIYFRLRGIKKMNKLLEEKVKLRTIQLEEHKEELLVSNEKLLDTIGTKDKFFSIIAHDLKNPMNTLIGFSDLLLKNWSKFEDSKRFKFIGMINSSSNHLFELLTNLLEWSRSQTGSIKVYLENININEIVRDNVLLLIDTAKNKNIDLNYKIDKNITAYADANVVDTILRNLISNAIKFTPKNGEINIVAYTECDKVFISVKDNGVGMSSEQINNLFKVNKNTSTHGTENEKGTGLGLIVCKEFANIIDGKITVESKEGKGTIFNIILNKEKLDN